MIDAYLRELRSALGFGPKARVLDETEDHLRSAAAAVGEKEAVRRFGPPDEIARAFHARRRWSLAGLALVLTLAFPTLSYPIVENSLPPAPWPAGEKPAHLEWKQRAILDLLVVAGGAMLIAASAWRHGGRLRIVASVVAASGLLVMALLGAVLQVQWAGAVPGTPSWLASVWLLQLGLAGLAVVLTGRAALLGGPRAGSVEPRGSTPSA